MIIILEIFELLVAILTLGSGAFYKDLRIFFANKGCGPILAHTITVGLLALTMGVAANSIYDLLGIKDAHISISSIASRIAISWKTTVSIAAVVAATASVIRNVTGSIKDALDIKRHMQGSARDKTKSPQDQ